VNDISVGTYQFQLPGQFNELMNVAESSILLTCSRRTAAAGDAARRGENRKCRDEAEDY
jgi:hypothetical protein